MDHIIKVILKIMSLMDMENILMLMDIPIKDNGKTIYLMEKDKHNILILVDIMANFSIIKDMEKVS